MKTSKSYEIGKFNQVEEGNFKVKRDYVNSDTKLSTTLHYSMENVNTFERNYNFKINNRSKHTQSI